MFSELKCVAVEYGVGREVNPVAEYDKATSVVDRLVKRNVVMSDDDIAQIMIVGRQLAGKDLYGCAGFRGEFRQVGLAAMRTPAMGEG